MPTGTTSMRYISHIGDATLGWDDGDGNWITGQLVLDSDRAFSVDSSAAGNVD